MLDKLLHFLLHIERASWTRGGSWRVEFLSWPGHDLSLVLGIGMRVGAWGLLWLYRHESRNLGAAARLCLAALRGVVLLGVLVMLLEPVLVFSKTEQLPSTVLVLEDASDSMGLTDAFVDAGHASQVAAALKIAKPSQVSTLTRRQLAERALVDAGVLDRLGGGGDRIVKQHGFAVELLAARTEGWLGAAPTSAAGATTQPIVDRSATAIGTAIRQAINAYQGQPLAGVLVVSDGQSNSGEPPARAAEFAAEQGVPIVCLAMGTPQGPRSAKITKLDVSPIVFVRDQSVANVLIESRGMSGQSATVVMEGRRGDGAWEEIGRAPIAFEENGRAQSVPFSFKEDHPVRLELRARLEDVSTQLATDTLTATADVRVVRERIRVLLVAGSTFPEVEFLRNALLRDDGVSVSTWLQTADADYEQLGDPPLKRMPATLEELNEFDCLILYDPDPALWPTEFPQMLQDFVTKAGGGLVFIAGERNTKNLFDRPDDPALAWVGLLPVVVEPGLYQTDVSVKLSSREAWKLEVTPEGKADPIFAFADSPERNDAILEDLPGMYWHFPVTRAKPGATVLARHGDARMRNDYGQHVLLATQLVGPGRTFFVAFDSTYRWRYLDEQYFDGFWARMVDRAGRNKQLGGRYPFALSADRTSYRPGSQVTVTARFDDPEDRTGGAESLHGEVELPDGTAMPITMAPKAGDAAAFEASFVAEKAGAHTVRIWTGDADAAALMRPATLAIPVELPNAELDNPVQDLGTLQTIARISGGAVFDLADAGKLPEAFKTRRVARVLEDRQEIWDAPVIFGAVLAALILEWAVRKSVGMI
jgi:hypothetical protein